MFIEVVEVEVQSSWNGGKVFASTLGLLIIDLSFEQHIVQATWTQHRHTYSTLAQVNLTHLTNEPVALWPAWPFTISICCMYYLKACSYEYSRVQIIDIHVYERWLFQIPPARFGSSMQCLSQTVGSRQFLWAFQLGRHRYCCCKIYTLTFFEFSICMCTTKIFYMFSSLSFDMNRVHPLSLYRGT